MAIIHERLLYYIPIIHTQADMGDFKTKVREAGLARVGESGWEDRAKVVDKFWDGVEGALAKLEIEYEGVRIYQDGLPLCGQEKRIVRELAEKHSRNHMLLEDLMARGAILMGTESGELLLEEYRFIQQIMARPDSGRSAQAYACRKNQGDDLLLRRDKYIAGRINSTLEKGEAGFLFIGMLHAPQKWINQDVGIFYPTLERGG